MIVSSRTPEGSPHRCPVCGKSVCVNPSDPAGDAPCPNCGHLLWFRQRLSERLGVAPANVQLAASFIDDLGLDSLDVVELIQEIEEEFGITIPDERAEQVRTVRDAIQIIEEQTGQVDDQRDNRPV